MEIEHFRVVLRTKDFDRSRRFYEEVLGFPCLRNWENQSGRGALFAAGPAIVEILGRTGGNGGRDEDFDYQGPVHKMALALTVPSAEKTYEELHFREKNIPGGLKTEPDGTLVFETHDPDGIKIQFREDVD
jgi:catechol 2,3-dioxygenase-like lactoylglutathione lyase family enzyme